MSARLAGLARLPRLTGSTVLGLIAACSANPVIDDEAAQTAAQSAGDVLTIRDGAFTAAQAESGRRVYDDFCATCHPAEFYETQLLVWQNAAVSEFFEALSATMPSENPGALATNQYLDVIAYIFSITGSPAGEQELTIDNAESVLIVSQ